MPIPAKTPKLKSATICLKHSVSAKMRKKWMLKGPLKILFRKECRFESDHRLH